MCELGHGELRWPAQGLDQPILVPGWHQTRYWISTKLTRISSTPCCCSRQGAEWRWGPAEWEAWGLAGSGALSAVHAVGQAEHAPAFTFSNQSILPRPAQSKPAAGANVKFSQFCLHLRASKEAKQEPLHPPVPSPRWDDQTRPHPTLRGEVLHSSLSKPQTSASAFARRCCRSLRARCPLSPPFHVPWLGVCKCWLETKKRRVMVWALSPPLQKFSMWI